MPYSSVKPLRRARLVTSSGILGALFVVPCALWACGGGTPAPKDETQAASSEAPAADSAAPAASASAAPSETASASAAPAASAAPPSDEPKPSATTDAAGNIKTNSDDPWLASHEMPPADVNKTMKAATGKVQACYKAGLKRDPSTTGDVKIRLVVTNDGKVRVWKDDGSTMSDEDVIKCVGGVVEKLKFPKQKSPGDAWGVYTIHFGG